MLVLMKAHYFKTKIQIKLFEMRNKKKDDERSKTGVKQKHQAHKFCMAHKKISNYNVAIKSTCNHHTMIIKIK